MPPAASDTGEPDSVGVAPDGGMRPSTVASRPRIAPRPLHGYFVTFTALFALLVLIGFSRTFFLPVAQGTFSRPPVVHIHGALFFAWTLLLVLQSVLAARKKLRWHRRIGSYAAWLIIPMLLMGGLVSGRDTQNDFETGGGEPRLIFFYGELADLAMFGTLAGLAMLLRHKPQFHKRLVLLGSLGLLGAAIGRTPELSGMYILEAMIGSMAVYDLFSQRRLHIATIAGGAFLLLMAYSQGAIGGTQQWLSFAHRILGV